MLGSTKGKL